MVAIPAEYHDLFERETIAHVATLMPDGMPHVTPVWIDYEIDRERLLVNTERGRQKEVNVERDPRLGASMTDPDDPYRRLGLMGTVVEMTTDGARDHIDAMARRYTGANYAGDIQTERLLLKVRPDRVF